MHGVPNQGQQHYTTMYLPEHMTTPMTMRYDMNNNWES